jgi:REP element-mobilizing transposase RayT
VPRPPRVEYENAIYHIVTRGDGRRRIFHDGRHYERFTEGLTAQVDRCGWRVIACCWMPNHIHALIKTPQPNLCRGMQHWLSGYANWYAKRNRRGGHLFQGRYKAFPVEDEGYYWNLSRYIHLNPCNGSKPLADSPEGYAHSSYRGYARKSRRVDWIDYEDHHRYWSGLHGGRDPAAAYRAFVKQGMVNAADPALDRLRDWVYGGEDFLKRIVALADSKDPDRNTRRRRRLGVVTAAEIITATATVYQVDPESYRGFRSPAGGRDIAAYLCRQYTCSTLAALSQAFGLGHPDSASDLIKRGRQQLASSAQTKRKVQQIERRLDLNPESRV